MEPWIRAPGRGSERHEGVSRTRSQRHRLEEQEMIQDISPLSLQTKACPVSDRAAGGSPHGWSINFTRLCFAENAESRLSVWIWGWDLDPWVPPLEQTAGFYWLVRSNLVNITQLFTAFDLFFPNVVATFRLRVVLFHETYAVTLIIQKITCILRNGFNL